jgi:hypothetical protein
LKVYISGPITGHDLDERRATFAAAARAVNGELKPSLIVNPMEVHPDCNYSCDFGQLADQPPYIHTWQCWMKHDIAEMMKCDTMVLLPGWDNSKGSALEHNLAIQLGFKVLHMDSQGCIEDV